MQNQIFWIIRNLLERESYKKPGILVFEDMHWADESSLAFLEYLFKVIPDLPILVIIVTRSSQEMDSRKEYLEWEKLMHGRLSNIQLTRLTNEQSREVVDYLLPENRLPQDLIDRIISLAGGNPLFLEEIIRMLIDRRLISIEKGQWEMEDEKLSVQNLAIPETLQGLILTRFDQLSSIQQRLLQVASIIGRDFNSDLLRVVLQITDPSLLDEILQQLVQRDIIENHSDVPNQDYRFNHVLMSDTIYSTLLTGDKTELHGQIGMAIEQSYPGQIKEYIDVLARHYFYSTNYNKALHYTKLAAKISSHNYANEQANDYFLQAEQVLSKVQHTVEDEIEVYYGLGNVNVFSGNYPESLENFQTAKEIFILNEGISVDGIGLDSVLRSIGEVYEHLGNYPDAIEFIHQAKKELEKKDNPQIEELAWIENDLGWIEYRRGNLELAQELLQSALKKLDEYENANLVASIANRLAGIYLQKSDLENASKHLQKSIFLLEQLGDRAAVARSYNNLGLLKWRLGDWQNAMLSFNRSLEIHKSQGDVEGVIELNSNIGLLLLDRGKVSESENYLTTALTLANRLGLSFQTGKISLHLARLMVNSGEYDKAIEYAEEGRTVCSVIGANEILADLMSFAGLAWLEKGEAERARQLGEEALRTIDEYNPENKYSEDRGRAYRLIAKTAIVKNNPAAASDYLKRSNTVFEKLGDKVETARNLVVKADLDELKGDSQTAQTNLNEARKIFSASNAVAELIKIKVI